MSLSHLICNSWHLLSVIIMFYNTFILSEEIKTIHNGSRSELSTNETFKSQFKIVEGNEIYEM